MKKFCGYCGTRIKTADEATALSNDELGYYTKLKGGENFVVFPNAFCWFVYLDAVEGKLAYGRFSNEITIDQIRNWNFFIDHINNQNPASLRAKLLRDVQSEKDGEDLDPDKDQAEIAKRYAMYVQLTNAKGLHNYIFSYGQTEKLREAVEHILQGRDFAGSEEASTTKKSPSRLAPEQQWEKSLQRFKLWDLLQRKKILYLTPPPVGSTPGGSAQILNILKNEYGIIALLSKLKKESPARAEAGERDYYDAALYEPSVVTRPKLGDRMIVTPEKIAELTLNGKKYVLGLIHSIG